MSSPAPGGRAARPLLVVIDPAARQIDGESVRIAKDVLCAGAPVKVCLPQSPEELARALARRGGRRPVVVGDDRALLRAVEVLHRERELTDCALSVVPVGGSAAIAVARSFGVPASPVEAARAVLDGVEQRLDLLVDDRGGVVFGTLRITAARAAVPPQRPEPAAERAADPVADPVANPPVDPSAGVNGDAGVNGGAGADRGAGSAGGRRRPPLKGWRSLMRTVRVPAALRGASTSGGSRPRSQPQPRSQPRPELPEVPEQVATGERLRVEADGVVLTELGGPFEQISVSAAGGLADVIVRPRAAHAPVRAQARAVTVSGADFRYRAAATDSGGPVRTRTWTVLPAALRLTVPAPRVTPRDAVPRPVTDAE